MSAKILIVDDSSTDRAIIKNMLSEYTTFTAENGLEAMSIIEENLDLDLIILDLNMPIMDGFHVLRKLKSDDKYVKIKTIILTNFDEIDNEILGLELGAVDYVRKPINIQSLKIRINIHLKIKHIQDKIEKDNRELDAMILKKTKELIATRDITIHALVVLLEVRNVESGNHTIRTQFIMKSLCEHLAKNSKYSSVLTKEYIELLTHTTPLHDIGKVGIPDCILLKPGKLSEEEFAIMKKHVNYGVEALKTNLCNKEDMPDFITTALEIVGTHHEKYNGKGYPNGLKNDEIPLAGRLMAIVDVYDALVNRRVYKPEYEHIEAIAIIKKEKGEHFDPEITDAFLEIEDVIHKINLKYRKEFVE